MLCYCPDPDSNWGHEDLQSTALPTELSGLKKDFNRIDRKLQIKLFKKQVEKLHKIFFKVKLTKIILS